jgi:CheY-like chemotaxis protein
VFTAADTAGVMPRSQERPADGTRPGDTPRCRILVVDDNRDAADILALLLQVWGHAVRAAYDGPAALEAAREHRPDVLFLDLELPGMTGYEVAARLRQELGVATPVLVALTGHGHEEDRQRTRDAGFCEHLVKPADPDDLRRLLATLAAPAGTASLAQV